jgi:iron complex outermembrane receptor protein
MGGSTDYSSTVYNIGAAFQFTDQFSVFGGFSQGFSLPDVGRTLRTTTDPNPLVNIKPVPVEIDNYELGARLTVREVTATVAGFYNTSDLGELFEPDPDSPPGVIEFIVTRQAQDFWGVEATISGPMFADRGRWGGSYTWIDGEQDTDDDGDPDGPIENTAIPPIKITAFGDYMISDDWTVRLQLLYSGDRNAFPEIAATSRGDHGRVESFWTVDASTTFRWGPGDVLIAVTNLFNKDYFPTSSVRSGNRPERYTTAPGAVARIGYSIRF